MDLRGLPFAIVTSLTLFLPRHISSNIAFIVPCSVSADPTYCGRCDERLESWRSVGRLTRLTSSLMGFRHHITRSNALPSRVGDSRSYFLSYLFSCLLGYRDPASGHFHMCINPYSERSPGLSESDGAILIYNLVVRHQIEKRVSYSH